MPGFTSEPAQLFAAAAALSDQAATGRGELARLAADAQDLFTSGWRGVAASAFADSWRRWHDGAALVLAALERNAAALDRCAGAYAAAEQASRAAVTREVGR
ncbi:MAG TPA: WXG100 family type VII secretion target [Jatrophihabitans sp.]|nr:WXG100 family type VII secretion target [Jatrophihabitans sp.]